MIGITNVGGGGGMAYAYIGVIYGAGETVTCTDGNKTYRAKDTSGLYTFPVPYAATWIVTATDGTKTKSESVVITSLWQDVVVNMTFWNGELFDHGNQFEIVTGGWVYNPNIKSAYATGYNGVTIEDTIEVVTVANFTECGAQTVNAVDLSDYSYLVIIGNGTDAGYYYSFFLANSKSGNPAEIAVARAQVASGSVTLDISEISKTALKSVYPTVFTANGVAKTDVSSIIAYKN